MGLFKRSKKEDELLDLESMEESLYTESKKEEIKMPLFKPSYSLTPSEVLSNIKHGISSTAEPSNSSPLEALKKRMLSNLPEVSDESEKEVEKKPDKTENRSYKTVGMFPDVTEAPIKSDIMTVEENPLPAENHDKPITYMPKKHDNVNENEQFFIDVESAIKHRDQSLLEKCSAYTVDDNGNDLSKDQKSDYTLESVSDILRSESNFALDELSKKCNMTIDDLGKKMENVGENSEKPEEKGSKRTEAFAKMVSESLKDKTAPDFVEGLKEQGVEVKEMNTDTPDISDLDGGSPKMEEDTNISNTATVRFTPIKDEKSDTGTIIISNMTRPLDIKSELLELEEKSEPENGLAEEFEEFEEETEEEEFKNLGESKKFLRKFSIAKRSAFLKLCSSSLLFFAGILFMIPPLLELNRDYPSTVSVILTVFCGLSILSNIDLLFSFKTFFTKKCSTDIPCFFAGILLFINCLSYCLKKGSLLEMSCLYSAVLCLFIIFMRALSQFFKTCYELSNLRQIATKRPKKAVSLIGDKGAAFAMAKNAVDGDALVALSHPTEFVGDYIKYTKHKSVMGGKLRLITITSLIVGIISAVINYSSSKDITSASFVLAAIVSFAAVPALFLIDELPNFCAASRLNKKGAMIAGRTAAERLEMANTAVLSSADFFPAGTITLQNLKVLSNNNIDDTLLRAASLTEAVSSTLAPLFKKIAKTNSAYTLPDSDTVKYEDRLGLSGWVDNELLFIGNRTLMEAHGIDIPSIEIDRKILHNGCFPIYVASKNTACALLVVKYDVDENVVRELRTLTNSGVTVLVNNCDPNISEEMLCDYFGLYSNSVKVMTNAGVHMYKTLCEKTESCSAPAAFRSSQLTFISILNCASKIKKSNSVLSFIYALFCLLGILFMAYYSAVKGGTGDLQTALPLIGAASGTLISVLTFLITKP